MMKRLVFPLLFFGLFFTLACDNQSTNSSVKPGAVTLMASPSDTAWTEQGVDAIPEADAIYLEWLPADDGLAAAFEIFRAADGETFESIHVANAQTMTFIDYTAQLYERYRYFVVALDEDGEEGQPSDTVSYRLLRKASNLQATQSPTPEFSWADPNQPPEAFYFIRVMEAASQAEIWKALLPSTYTPDHESVVFGSDGNAAVNNLETGKSYIWRIDILGSEANSGSESAWQTLTID